MFEDLILGPNAKKVTKAADAADFAIVNGEYVRRDPFVQPGGSPKPTGTDINLVNAGPMRFPGSSSIVDRPVREGDDSVMPLGYEGFVEPSEQDLTAAGTMPSFQAQAEAERVQAHGFVAPEPGRFPADGPKAVRLGNSWILKSEVGIEPEETN